MILGRILMILFMLVVNIGSYYLVMTEPNRRNDWTLALSIACSLIIPIWTTFLTLYFFIEKGWL